MSSDEGKNPAGAESPDQVVVNGTSEDDRAAFRPADIDAVRPNPNFSLISVYLLSVI